jgi:transposase-like protein
MSYEPKDKEILSITTYKDRNMLVADKFLSKVVEKYGSHPVSTDGGIWYPASFSDLKNRISGYFRKDLVLI